MDHPDLHHFYHCFADGAWQTPVTEHFDALERFGLYGELTSLHVGIVGHPDNRAEVIRCINEGGYSFTVAAVADEGWEQVTLDPLYRWVQTAEGLVSYAHTKGAANYNPVNDPWRRSMEYFNYVRWETPVEALMDGKAIAGCHWICGGPSSNPAFGTGGMFGGNYWWTRCELLRQNVPPGHESRFAAEHWLGQLSEVMPIIAGSTICDMNPAPITDGVMSQGW